MMNIRRMLPLAALAVATWIPSDALAQTATRRVDDATRAVEARGRQAEAQVDDARRTVERGANPGRALSERDILAKMARAERDHVEKMAKIARMRALYNQRGDAAKVRDVDGLRTAELARRQRQIAKARSLIGTEKYDVNSKRLRAARKARKDAAEKQGTSPAARKRFNNQKDSESERKSREPSKRGAVNRDGAANQRKAGTRDAGASRGNTSRQAAPARGATQRGSTGNTRGRGR